MVSFESRHCLAQVRILIGSEEGGLALLQQRFLVFLITVNSFAGAGRIN